MSTTADDLVRQAEEHFAAGKLEEATSLFMQAHEEEARSLAGGAFAGRAVPSAALAVNASVAAELPPLAGAGRVKVPLGRRRMLDVLLPRER